MFGLEQPKMSDLLQILPKPEIIEDEYGCLTLTNTEKIEAVMPELRKATQDCPACNLAVLRQKGIPIPAVHSFNFTEECKSWWADFNINNRPTSDDSYMYG